jgi:ribonuclease P protein subunit RPR2
MRGRMVGKKDVSREIVRLIRLALDISTPISYGDRYVSLARKFSMKYKVRIPREYKIYICKGCKGVLKPGVTAVFRLRSRPKKSVYVKCLRCGHVYRRVYRD